MTIIQQMIDKYHPMTLEERKHAMKEVLQEVVLAGLSKTDFFKHAAFYGGTALRIFYGVKRFSEDLDFSLLVADDAFEVNHYFQPIRHVLKSLGLNFDVSKREKRMDSTIDSAFIKGNTKETMLTIYPDSEDSNRIISNEKIIIKFEIDVNPPLFAKTEIKYRLLPFPYQVRVYDQASLFAGKVHAVLARSWKNRVKGRDLYDYIYYLSLNVNVNLKHLEARLKQTNTIKDDVQLTRSLLIELLANKFDHLDYEIAKADVRPFIKEQDSLDLWSPEFFKSLTNDLRVD